MTRRRPETRLICPLTAPDVASMRRAMDEAAALGADAVELRLDYLRQPPDEGQLKSLLDAPPLPTIVTCRPRGWTPRSRRSARSPSPRPAPRTPSALSTCFVPPPGPPSPWPWTRPA